MFHVPDLQSLEQGRRFGLCYRAVTTAATSRSKSEGELFLAEASYGFK
jgi:hypothetical protein